MYIISSLLLAALASLAHAQATPKGFTPTTNTKLEVLFNSTSVETPGQMLSKATTATQPQIALSAKEQGNMSETYMFVMLDLDVPPAEGSTARRVLLHAMNTGFKATQQRVGGTATILASTQKGPAAYLPPGPPATDTMAHRYVQLLFRQPDALAVQASDFANTTGRFNFDVTTFMKENGVGAPIAANFFMVDGRANATGARNATVPFEGGVGRKSVSFGLVGVLGGLAVLMA